MSEKLGCEAEKQQSATLELTEVLKRWLWGIDLDRKEKFDFTNRLDRIECAALNTVRMLQELLRAGVLEGVSLTVSQQGIVASALVKCYQIASDDEMKEGARTPEGGCYLPVEYDYSALLAVAGYLNSLSSVSPHEAAPKSGEVEKLIQQAGEAAKASL